MMTLYFSYGANMDPVHMAEQCPGAVRQGRAVLPDHAFGIAARGFGTPRPAPGRRIEGVLWRLTAADEAALDRFEDVAGDFYRKRQVMLRDEGGAPVEAMIYEAVDDAPGRAAPGYLERILEVAAAEGFPKDYIGELQAASAS